ncbi:peptidase_S8 domain-containing protein [Haematococcus lacustris]|uniref:Peptidase_S8 domain-containing protein n=1 Tax=Haematococcus lacustris TaxID=44745 RepID=A0A699YY95_HAELA|nr:peptidase_S8 domain-containing protein [Haematococcus lacustris]
MSLGVAGGSWSATLESATRTLINTYNITVVVASGNSAIDACTVVPASLPESITVAASSMDNKFDPNRINDSRMLPGTPNRMIYTRGSALLALTTQPLVQAAAGNTSTSVP